MKTDLASNFPSLAAHPPITAPIATPAPAHEPVDAQLRDFNLARDLVLFARVLRRAPGGRRVTAIFLTTIVITIGNMVGQVWLNEWNGRFFDALAHKELVGFLHLLWAFLGIIAVLLYSHGLTGGEFRVPFWVVLACQAAMALGTLFGGWRIVHTMGSKITKLQPVGGFAAETGAAIAIFTATHLGIPVSTTHAITGAIVGVGSTRRLSAVRWGIARRIVWAWVLTIPGSATIAALAYWAVTIFGLG